MIAGHDGLQGRRLIRTIALNLTEAERDQLKRVPKPPEAPNSGSGAVASGPERQVPIAELEALNGSMSSTDLTSSQIADRCKNSVVLIGTDDGTGTGFFVGSTGYILTCAHVLPDAGTARNLKVNYRIRKNGSDMSFSDGSLNSSEGCRPRSQAGKIEASG